MPKTVPAALQTHLNNVVTTVATCLKVTRRDGTQYRFTDHDENLLIGTDLYVAALGYQRSQMQTGSTLAVDNLDLGSILGAAGVTEGEIRAGLFDAAEIEVFLVNWSNLGQGHVKLRAGWIGEIKVRGNGTYEAELRGLTQAYQNNVIQIATPTCRADLGDHQCKIRIDPSPWEASFAYKTRMPREAGHTVFMVPNPGDDTFYAPRHGLFTGSGPYRFRTTGTLPPELSLTQDYWVIRVEKTILQVATSQSNANNGNEVTFSTAGTGTIFLDVHRNIVRPSAYNDRYFVATNDGTSGGGEPSWATGLGSQTNDGSIVWEAIRAYRIQGSVDNDTAQNRRTFTITSITDAPDAFLTGGVCEFTSGENAGIRREVKEWTLTGGPLGDKQVVLFLPTSYPIASGDTLTLTAGCDKLATTCQTTFKNIFNYHGEPWVPGQDFAFRSPDAQELEQRGV